MELSTRLLQIWGLYKYKVLSADELPSELWVYQLKSFLKIGNWLFEAWLDAMVRQPTWQVKQDLWKVWPAALIISAMNTVFSHLLTNPCFYLQDGCCQLYLGQMSAPPHLGFGFGPPDPGAFVPREEAQYVTQNISSFIGQPTSHIGRWVVWHKWFFGSNVGLGFVVDLENLGLSQRSMNFKVVLLVSPHLGLSCSPFHHPSTGCRLHHQSRNPWDQNSSWNWDRCNIGRTFFINTDHTYHCNIFGTLSKSNFCQTIVFYRLAGNLLLCKRDVVDLNP